MSPPRMLHLDQWGVLTNRSFLDDPHLARLLAAIGDAGFEARVVGGAVRNALIGLPGGDIDIATTATPEEVIELAKRAKFRPVPTGVAHGTVTVVVSGWPFEVTTLREDVSTDGRHAVVRFGQSFEEDAKRRDFTINAMSCGADGFVHDYTGGVADLGQGIVRFIGDAEMRIREDYLRILRFFRFSASYATGDLDFAGLAASVRCADGIERLSRERIRAELLKLLAAPRAVRVVQDMSQAGLLTAVLGGPGRPERFARLRDVLAVREGEPDPILCLAALAVGTPFDVVRLRETLRLSNEERNRLEKLAARIGRTPTGAEPPSTNDLAALLFVEGRQCAVDLVTLRHVDSGRPPDDAGWQAATRFVAIAPVPAMPVSGADIMARGVRSGPMVGEILKSLQASWIRSGFPDSPTILHRLLEEAIQDTRNSR